MHRSTARFLAIVAAVAFGGCGYKPAGSVSPAGAAGRGGMGGTSGAGGTGGAAGAGTGGTGGMRMPPVIILDGGNDLAGNSTPDANCGARSKTAMKVAPDILIVLDRSGSMNDDINNQMCRPDGGFGGTQGCGAQSKWALMIPAITQVVTETDVDVNWGLKWFPDNGTGAGTCSVNTSAAVPVGPGNGAAITAAIMGATGPTGGVVGYNGTPTRSAAEGATTYMSTLTDMSPKFILLATDGLPTCAGDGGAAADDSAAAVTAVGAARTAGFPTFVVGIATGGSGPADATLSSMATAGGLPRMATPAYYPVTNATDLAAAIKTLIGAAGTCTFQIGPNPTDDGTTSLDRINVFGDGEEITRDPNHANGYDYTDDTKTSIEVHGPLCAQIMSGEIKDVTVTFRCLVP
jgi:hypothetical protein